MMIFGGLTQRYRDFKVYSESQKSQLEKNETLTGEPEIYDIYNNCEDYENLMGEELPYFLKTCGEEMLNDVWIYNTRAKTWQWIKPSFNANIDLYVKQPAARYGHAGSYVELFD